MNLEEVKGYLRVDYGDDDSLIELLIQVAKDYVSNGFSSFDEENPTHKLLLLKTVKSLYDNREDFKGHIPSSIRLQQWLGEGTDG